MFLNTIQGLENVLREDLQRVILLALGRERFFVRNVFYGGTALRLLYGLRRSSEDLDFVCLEGKETFSWEPFVPAVRKSAEAYGFSVSGIELKPGQTTPKMLVSVMLKESLSNRKSLYSLGQATLDVVHAHKKVMVRLEIDLEDPCHPEPVTEQILLPSPFLVSTYQKPDLFAGKMHAVLFRSWKFRVKGRDWFDMLWYLGQEIPLRMKYLEGKMKQSGKLEEGASLTPDLFRDHYVEVCRKVNFSRAFDDVEPFLEEEDVELVKDAFTEKMMLRLVDRFRFG
jgi:predicted nucleotidyltransferase component of viral defense system